MNKLDEPTVAEQNVNFRQIGKPRTRTDAPGKVFGKTPYAGDYVMPDMLHARVLRAKVPSARMTRLDVSKARALPGVASVLTFRDLKIGTVATDIPGQTGFKRRATDQQILVDELVRYQGEPIAIVAAETVEIAQHALSLIEVDLEPVPGVYNVFDAQKPDSPRFSAPTTLWPATRSARAMSKSALLPPKSSSRTPSPPNTSNMPSLNPRSGLVGKMSRA